MIRRLGYGALLIGTLTLAACSGSQGSASKPTSSGTSAQGGGGASTTVKSADTMRFAPAALTGRPGAAMTVVLDNAGSALPHDFTIDNLGGTRVHAEAAANGRANASFTPPAGTYEFYCSQPGHKEAGMVGTLTVS